MIFVETNRLAGRTYIAMPGEARPGASRMSRRYVGARALLRLHTIVLRSAGHGHLVPTHQGRCATQVRSKAAFALFSAVSHSVRTVQAPFHNATKRLELLIAHDRMSHRIAGLRFLLPLRMHIQPAAPTDNHIGSACS